MSECWIVGKGNTFNLPLVPSTEHLGPSHNASRHPGVATGIGSDNPPRSSPPLAIPEGTWMEDFNYENVEHIEQTNLVAHVHLQQNHPQ